jgi:hypothetical protein
VNGPTIEIRTDQGSVICAADTSDASCEVEIRGGQLLISARNLSPESIPCTIRWKYWFSLA